MKKLAVSFFALIILSCDGGSGGNTPGGENIANGFGLITGTADSIGVDEILSVNPAVFTCSIDFGNNGYDSSELSQLSDGAQVIIDKPAAGSSAASQAFAFEILHRIESALYLKYDDEISYIDPSGKKINFMVSIDGSKLGVTVCRACNYPMTQPYPYATAKTLISSKLEGLHLADANVSGEDTWVKSILVVVCYGEATSDTVMDAWSDLDAVVKGDTIIYIVTTYGDDEFLY